MKRIDLFCLALLVALMGLLVFYFYQMGNADNRHRRIAAAYDDSLRVWKDQAGHWLAEKQVLEIEREQDRDWIARLQKDLAIKVKNLETAVRLSLQQQRRITTQVKWRTQVVKDTVLVQVEDKDTVMIINKIGNFSYRDDWLHAEGVIGEENLLLNYTTFDSLSLAITRSKTGWNQVAYQAKVFSHNPNSRITGLDAFQPYKEGRLKFSLFAGPALTLEGLTPLAVGLGVSYNF